MTKTTKKTADKTAKTTGRSNGAKKATEKTTKPEVQGRTKESMLCRDRKIIRDAAATVGNLDNFTKEWVDEHCQKKWREHWARKQKAPNFKWEEIAHDDYIAMLRNKMRTKQLDAPPLKTTQESTQQDESADDDDDDDEIMIDTNGPLEEDDDDSSRLGVGATKAVDIMDEEEDGEGKENEPPVNETEEVQRLRRELADEKAKRKEEKRQMVEKLADEKNKAEEEKRKAEEEKRKRRNEKRKRNDAEQQRNDAEQQLNDVEQQLKKLKVETRKLEALKRRNEAADLLRAKYPNRPYMTGDEVPCWDANHKEVANLNNVAYKCDGDFEEVQQGESSVAFRALQSFNVPQETDAFPGYITGKIHLPPGGIKDAESIGSGTSIFFVISCQPQALEVATAVPHTNEGMFDPNTARHQLLETGDQFRIAPHNWYRLQNHSETEDCHLFYALIKPNRFSESMADNH